MTKKIGILTGGGDCGGLNAAIEAVVKSADNEGWEVYGIRRGWEGLVFNNIFPLRVPGVDGIHSETGTILQTSRTNPYRFTGELDGQILEKADVSERVIENAREAGLEAVIAAGGDDTLSVVSGNEDKNIPGLINDYGNDVTFIGIPKTMDGDLQTYSLGLDTAINRAKQKLEDFIPLLKANGSIGLVEIFGRDVGRVTFKAGIAAGADAIFIPEIPVDLDYSVDFIADRYDKRAKSNNGVSYVLIAIAEGTKHPITGQQVYLDNGEDSFGHGKLGGVGYKIAKLVQDRLKDDPRITAHRRELDIKIERPTYDVRAGATLYSDSYTGQKLGVAAVKYLKDGAESGMAITNFNEDGQIESMPIRELIKPRPVHMEVLKMFERAGLYSFGRRPDQLLYTPESVVSSPVRVSAQ
tara:strand:+ start:193 stop:1425 length:1233 start_codon:yes stop_codon:yes gene_type:complete